MKNRRAPAALNVAAVPEVTVREILSWPAPRHPGVKDSALVPRENQVVTVTGWVRLTKTQMTIATFIFNWAPIRPSIFRKSSPRFHQPQRRFASSLRKPLLEMHRWFQ
jgi:hypothetical protein